MELFDAIAARRSIRQYSDRPVEQDVLKQVLEAGRLAPSAKNIQDWRFIVVRDIETRAQLVEAAAGQAFVGRAPVVIVCCSTASTYKMRCGQPAGTIDVAIAIDHMTLAATALGLGTCWVGAFYADCVHKLLDIPADAMVVELLTLGYPAEDPAARPRLPLEELVYTERWGNR